MVWEGSKAKGYEIMIKRISLQLTDNIWGVIYEFGIKTESSAGRQMGKFLDFGYSSCIMNTMEAKKQTNNQSKTLGKYSAQGASTPKYNA